VTPAVTTFCFASDGAWQSINGAAFTQLGAATLVVTSFNGRTGAVMPVASDYPFPAPPVTSVNGKTGVVVISASTSLQ
jgi:hypothetical protein